MKLTRVRELVAEMFGSGLDKVWFDNQKLTEIQKALTKDDLRALVAEGAIKKLQKKYHSRGRARILHLKKKKGRKKGKGKRQGTSNARTPKKDLWMRNVRAQRSMLKKLRKENPKLFDKVSYSEVYKKIKGGFFKGKKYVELFVKGAS